MFSVQSMKELLHYGIPFQGNSFLALVKDDLLIIFLGQTLGLGNLGLISFGKKYAEMAVRLVTDNINRVAFPVFARVQDNKELLAKSLMRNLFYGSLIVFPIVIGAMFTFDSGLKLFHGYYAKWNGALWSFYFFSLSTLCVSLMTPFINLFNAVKKVKLSLLFMVLWTCLMWAFIPVATHFLGYNAVAPIFLIVNSTVVFVILQAKKIVHFSILKELHGIFIGSLLMVAYLGIIRFIAINYLNSPELHLVFSVIGSPIVYGGTIPVVYGVETFRNVLRTLRPSSAGGSPLDDQH
jgi:O-antigen/teichoic acid export membrane protein